MSPHIQVEKCCRGKRSNWCLALESYFHLSFWFWLHITSAFLHLISSHFFWVKDHRLQQEQSVLQMFLPSPFFHLQILIIIKDNEETIRNSVLLLWINHQFWYYSPGNVSALENQVLRIPLHHSLHTAFSLQQCGLLATTPASNHCWNHHPGPSALPDACWKETEPRCYLHRG